MPTSSGTWLRLTNRKVLSVPLRVMATLTILVTMLLGGASAQQPSAAPPATTTPASPPAAEAQESCLWRGRYVLTLEGHKVGQQYLSLFRLAGSGPAIYRLEVNRFLKTNLSDKRATITEKCLLQMDGDFTALSFDTTRTDLVGTVHLQGTVAGGQLKVTATVGEATRAWTAPVKDKPTFDAALLFALAAEPPVEGRTISRLTIDERYGLVGTAPAAARVMQRVSFRTPVDQQDGFAVVEQRGNAVTAHLVDTKGRLVRSEGQNHNLSVQAMTERERQDLSLEGNVPWQNRLGNVAGRTLTSQAFGYALDLPSYPYVASVGEDGQVVMADSLTSDEAMHLVVVPLEEASGDDAKRRQALFATWCRMVGAVVDTAESQTTVGGLPALTVRGKITLGGRAADFETTLVVREHLGYIIGRLQLQPAPGPGDGAYRRMVDSIRWAKIFGRERGRWDKNTYISEAYNYCVELLAPGWRLPEERSGVTTSVESIREDHSALVAVMIAPAANGATLLSVADQYEKDIRINMTRVTDLNRAATKLGGRDAVLLTYSAKAIDDEPTESQHVLTVDAGRLVVLTLVTKKTQLEANRAHFARARQSFQFVAAESGK
jgi:hypothetical protein